jgi:hypothetical protein
LRFIYILFCILISASCAHQTGPSSSNHQTVAHDEMAQGKIEASAVKILENEDVCFEITLIMKGVDQREAMVANWQLAWVDQASRYHLLNMSQRDPASEPKPYGAHQEWTNSFRSCTPKVRLGDVKSLFLTPKELSYKETEGMKLEWH